MASQVVDILLQRGRDAANADLARGAAWSGAAQQLGQIPGQIAEQRSRQQVLDLQSKRLQLETQRTQAEADATQRALKGQQDANDLIANFPRNPDGTFDAAGWLQGAAAKGVPLDQQEHLTKTVDGINGVITSWNRNKQDHAADLADVILKSHTGSDPVTADSVHVGMAAAKALGLASDDEEQRITKALGTGADPEQILKAIRQQGSKYKDEKPVVVPQGASLFSPTGQVLATGTPKPPTAPELALRAAGGDPSKAMALLKPQTPRAPTTSEIALKAAQGDPEAVAAMKLLKPEHAAADPQSPQTQEKLEQEYRGILQREISSRSGGLGLEDQKVNQANHLLALLDQYKGKNMPAQIQSELALGLARLTSPSGQVGVELEKEFNQRTAEGSISKAVAWLTGDPTLVNAAPEQLREMFRDSITRQGNVAVESRGNYFKAMRSMAPTDLSADRRTKLEQGMGLNALRTSKPGTEGARLRQEVPDHPGTFAVSTDGGKSWKVE